MIRRSSERIVDKPQHKFGAPGFITVNNLINDPDELNGKGRLCYHVHAGDSEIYYILSGKGEYSDNGAITTVGPGDVTFCPPGEGHGILSIGDEPLELIALILYE